MEGEKKEEEECLCIVGILPMLECLYRNSIRSAQGMKSPTSISPPHNGIYLDEKHSFVSAVCRENKTLERQ
jgi:hypothetical protein